MTAFPALPLDSTTLASTMFFARTANNSVLVGRAKPGWYFRLYIAMSTLSMLRESGYQLETQDGAPITWDELDNRMLRRSWPSHDKRAVVPRGALECPRTRLWRAEVGAYGCLAHGPANTTFDFHEYPA
jgi:hypothetical protein